MIKRKLKRYSSLSRVFYDFKLEGSLLYVQDGFPGAYVSMEWKEKYVLSVHNQYVLACTSLC